MEQDTVLIRASPICRCPYPADIVPWHSPSSARASDKVHRGIGTLKLQKSVYKICASNIITFASRSIAQSLIAQVHIHIKKKEKISCSASHILFNSFGSTSKTEKIKQKGGEKTTAQKLSFRAKRKPEKD